MPYIKNPLIKLINSFFFHLFITMLIIFSTSNILRASETLICSIVVDQNIVNIDTSIIALDDTIMCGVTSQVRLKAGNADLYQWYRNGQIIPGATSRFYSALNSGYYKVIVSGQNGQKDSSRAIQVFINPFPDASFTVNKNSQCLIGNEYIFTNTSSIEKGIISSVWYFGDGKFQVSQNANYTYSSVGSYDAKLITTSEYGCKDTFSLGISVLTSPKADFEVNSIEQCYSNNKFIFSNKSSFSGLSLEYRWDFGDGGSTGTTNPVYSYSTVASFNVKLIAYNSKSCVDSVVKRITINPSPNTSFSINNSQQCQNGNYFQFTNTSPAIPGNLNTFWSFGDGVNTSVFSPNYSYASPGTYDVKLVLVTGKGCKDSLSTSVIINPSPIPKFDLDSYTQCFKGNLFQFINSSSVIKGTLAFSWDFGDGIGQSNVSDPKYSYNKPGSYLVTVRANTVNNCLAVFNKIITVKPNAEGILLDQKQKVICDGSTLQLTASGSEFYQWLLDSVPIIGAVSNIYNATSPGVYQVQFLNNQGCSSLSSTKIQLSKVYQPISRFIYDKSCTSFPTLFTNKSDVARSDSVDYLWDFGDKSNSLLSSPSHTYGSPGIFLVKLTITPRNCRNLSSSSEQQILIQNPDLSVKYPPLSTIKNQAVLIKSREFKGANYQWLPSSNLSETNIFNPLFKGDKPQNYLIVITTKEGCVMVDTLEIRMFSEKNIFVPDLFSPNGDGKNDRLEIYLVGIKIFNFFKVYNRWGQLLFQTTNPQAGWDGRYLGVLQPVGTYIWQVEGLDIDGKIMRRSGSTILIH